MKKILIRNFLSAVFLIYIPFTTLFGQLNSSSFIVQTSLNGQLEKEIISLNSNHKDNKTIEINTLSPYTPNLYKVHDISENELIQLKSINIYEKITPVELRKVSNDPLVNTQWNLDLIQMKNAWDLTTGGLTYDGKKIVIAIIDDGFDINHPDLVGNLWKNKNEIPNNNIDDDQNGYIDDIHGLDLGNKTGSFKVSRHGTNTMGIVGASGNNEKGITGINWDIEMMLLSNARSNGDIIEGLQYIAEQRRLYDTTNGELGAYVVVVSMSLAIPRTFESDFPIWCDTYNNLGQLGILSTVPVPNENVNIDEVGDMPALCSSDYIIAVTNITSQDELAMESGIGPINVDIGAPGGEHAINNGLDSPTTSLNNEYEGYGGSSAATPHVGGAIALMYSAKCQGFSTEINTNPSETALKIKNILLEESDLLPSLREISVSEGRLNVFKSLLKLSDFCDNDNGLGGQLTITAMTIQQACCLNFSYQAITLDPLEYTLFNIEGKLLTSGIIEINPFENVNVEIPSFSVSGPGLYFLSLKQNDKEIIKKLFLY